jgi:hypothetical protein
MYGYIIFIVSMAVSIVCISYDSMARAKGWPVGEILSNDESVPKIAAMISVLLTLGKSFMMFHWWSPLVILLCGWLLALILTMTLKKNVQFIGVIGIFPALAITAMYLSESKPFGMLHYIFR